MKLITEIVFSQNKVSKTVADISVSGTKLHISYSDGSSKDMEMPPATSLQLPLIYAEDGTVEGYVVVNKGISTLQLLKHNKIA